MMDDLKIREFKNNIINYMNQTDIPLEVKRLVLSEILNETTVLVNSDITKLVNALKEEQKHKEEAKSDPENSPE